MKLLTFVLGTMLAALIFYWYVWLWIGYPIRYWSQLMPLTAIFLLMQKAIKGSPVQNVLTFILSALFTVSLFAQVMFWTGLIHKLPIFTL